MKPIVIERMYCTDCETAVIPEVVQVYAQTDEEYRYENKCSSCGSFSVSPYICSICDKEADYKYYPLIRDEDDHGICLGCYAKKHQILDNEEMMLKAAKEIFYIEKNHRLNAIDIALNKQEL